MRSLFALPVCGVAALAFAQPTSPIPNSPRLILTETAALRTEPPSGPLNVIVGKQVQGGFKLQVQHL